MNPLLVMLIGLAVVFFGLLCLIGMIYLMSFIFRLVSGERRLQKSTAGNKDLKDLVTAPGITATQKLPAQVQLTGEQRRQLIAAVSVALAEHMGTEPSALRIHSIRRVGGSKAPSGDRRELMAAVSAAIAMQLDTDVSGIRVHSIRKVG